MKNLNQIRETALQHMAHINNEIQEAPALDARRIARLMDAREYHTTVLAMCDRLDSQSQPSILATASRNYSDD